MFFISKEAPQLNGEIRDKEVRVITADGEQLGIMSAREAQQEADKRGQDLVKIAPQAKPPVVKIMDYSKFRFAQALGEDVNIDKAPKLEGRQILMFLSSKINK